MSHFDQTPRRASGHWCVFISPDITHLKSPLKITACRCPDRWAVVVMERADGKGERVGEKPVDQRGARERR